MPRVLEVSEIDQEQEAVDTVLTAAEEAESLAQLVSTDEAIPDLTDGGVVGSVRVTPRRHGKIVPKGRPAARRAWTWNGMESLLPLAWNPEGTMHDGARRYLLKRHCTCCGRSGFRGVQCLACVKNTCSACKSSTVKGKIIPNFYLKKEDVPFPARFYGDVDCFLENCTRRGSMGFMSEQDMRMHARTRHKMEYQAYLEARATSSAGGAQLAVIEKRLAELEALEGRLLKRAEEEEEKQRAIMERMAKARASRGKRKY